VALALTFDEFGMWLSLGGTYNNHLTFDAIVIIAALLTLVALATTVEKRHPATGHRRRRGCARRGAGRTGDRGSQSRLDGKSVYDSGL